MVSFSGCSLKTGYRGARSLKTSTADPFGVRGNPGIGVIPMPSAATHIPAAVSMLAWRWYVELPIRSPRDERTREGDDHPARLFLRFLTDRGEKRAMEVIWGNRLKAGDYKFIGGFPHFVADGGDDRVGRWLDEKIDLARIYGRMRRRRTWSISRCSATATTHTAASATSPMSGLNGGDDH